MVSFGLVVELVLGVGLILGWGSLASSRVSWIPIVQVLLVFCGFALMRVKDGRIDFLSPLSVFLVLYLLMYPLQVVLVDLRADAFSDAVAPQVRSLSSAQATAASYETAALAAVLAGYTITAILHRRKHRIRHPARRLLQAQGAFKIGVVIALGVILFSGLVLASGGLGTLSDNLYNRTTFFSGKNYLALGPTIILTAGMGDLLRTGEWPPKRRTLLILGIGFLASLFVGSKTALAVPILMIIIIIHCTYHRFRPLAIIALSLTGVVILTSYNLYFRNALPRHVPFSQAVSEQGGPAHAISDDFSGNTFFGHQAMTLLVANVPTNIPHLGVQELAPLLVAPIPRGLLPGKPAATGPTVFTQLFNVSKGTTIPETGLGEMFLDGGFSFLLFGCFILGSILELIYHRSRRTVFAVYVQAAVTATITTFMRGDLYSVAIMLLVLVLLGAWLLRDLPWPDPSPKRCGSARNTISRRRFSLPVYGPAGDLGADRRQVNAE